MNIELTKPNGDCLQITLCYDSGKPTLEYRFFNTNANWQIWDRYPVKNAPKLEEWFVDKCLRGDV